MKNKTNAPLPYRELSIIQLFCYSEPFIVISESYLVVLIHTEHECLSQHHILNPIHILYLRILYRSLFLGRIATNRSKHATDDTMNDSFLFVNHPSALVINDIYIFAAEIKQQQT